MLSARRLVPPQRVSATGTDLRLREWFLISEQEVQSLVNETALLGWVVSSVIQDGGIWRVTARPVD